jgi:hypothetical protein
MSIMTALYLHAVLDCWYEKERGKDRLTWVRGGLLPLRPNRIRRVVVCLSRLAHSRRISILIEHVREV